ncbi:MupA/Atu3671 family FMN-dependent luciferase-like monooxygenase, partial [Legionella oakridgensis]|uniref:MupA/Atu3671 family FMN-dependent luciferase-like monooxygenase n=1 Tax=Legionella oakridgensis TaxID=29423 RepID=UPI00138AFC15
MNFIDSLYQAALLLPNRIAFRFITSNEQGSFDESTLTYQELLSSVQIEAKRIEEVSQKGDRVLILLPSGLEYIVSFLACLHSGRIAVPAYPPRSSQHQKRLQSILKDSLANLIIGSTELEKSCLFSTPESKPYSILVSKLHRNILPLASMPFEPTEVAYLQYTSGSTAVPKGVMISHANILNNLEVIAERLDLVAEDRFLHWLPLYHDMGLVFFVLMPLYLRLPCTFFSAQQFAQSPLLWLQAISHYKTSFSVAPNFAYEYCVQQASDPFIKTLDLSHWRIAMNTSESIQLKTLKKFAETFSQAGFKMNHFLPAYGLAECVVGVSGSLYSSPTQSLISCGKILNGFLCRIVNPDNKNICMEGKTGEIWLQGPSIALGYWQKLEETKTSFHAYTADGKGPFLRTGDLGFLKNGHLYIVGRLKELMIFRGSNYYPQDLELCLEEAHPALALHASAAFSIDIDGEEKLVIAAELRRTHRKSPPSPIFRAIQQAIVNEFGVTPYDIILLRPASLPKTSSGKIQRTEAKRLYQSKELIQIASLQSETPTQAHPLFHRTDYLAQDTHSRLRYLAERFKDTLQEQGLQIEVETLFTQPISTLGLDSIQMVHVIQRLESILKCAIPLHSLDLTKPLPQSLNTLDAFIQFPSSKKEGPLNCTSSNPVLPLSLPPYILTQSSTPSLDFSLFFFSEKDASSAQNPYDFYRAAARLADINGLKAIWLPERHFHAFGGLFPNPSVLASWLAAETQTIRLRAGSVVLPLHNPLRVAEEWAVVDQLSQGRVDLSFATGWNANDFVLAPQDYTHRLQGLYKNIELVQTLWEGQTIERQNGHQESVKISIYPRPIQPKLAIWMTCSNSIERFIEAGRAGFHVLTALLFQDLPTLAGKIKAYRQAREEAGYDPQTGYVTLMIHTFLGKDDAYVRENVKAPFIHYLKTSKSLWQQEWKDLSTLDLQEQDTLLDYAFERYYQTAALFGSLEKGIQLINDLSDIGVNEIAALIDFGVEESKVLHHLHDYLDLVDIYRNSTGFIPDSQKYALSIQQQGFFFIYQYSKLHSAIYNTHAMIELRGPLNISLLRKACQGLLHQYPILKMRLMEDHGQIHQCFDSSLLFRVHDMATEKEPHWESWLSAAMNLFERVFSIHLFVFADHHLLIIRWHHIAEDALSYQTLWKTLWHYYKTLLEGKSLDFKANIPSYLDYCIWQDNYLHSEHAELARAFWSSIFKEQASYLQAIKKPQTTQADPWSAKQVEHRLSQVLRQRISSFCKKQHTTLYAFFHSILSILLYRYSGETHVQIATPVNTRPSQAFDESLGLFINLLLIPVQVDDSSSYQDFLQKVNLSILECLEYRHYPYHHLVHENKNTRTEGNMPFIEVILNVHLESLFKLEACHNLPFKAKEWQHKARYLMPTLAHRQHQDHPLSLTIFEDQDEWVLSLSYQTKCFEDEQMHACLQHFQHLLEQVLIYSQSSIQSLKLLTPYESHQILEEWNETDAPYPKDKT